LVGEGEGGGGGGGGKGEGEGEGGVEGGNGGLVGGGREEELLEEGVRNICRQKGRGLIRFKLGIAHVWGLKKAKKSRE